MLDKNGVEIRTGDVVKISNAYFKNDNGLYFVHRSPGDLSWSGKDYSLQKIKRNGELSTAKHNIAFWPLGIFINDPWKRAEAVEWNKAHAEIEVIVGIDRSHIAESFRHEAQCSTEMAQDYEWRWGKDNDTAKLYNAIAEQGNCIADRITAEDTIIKSA